MIKIEPKLEAFLKEEGALENFKEGLLNKKASGVRGREVSSIKAGFVWHHTEQGFNYWKNLHYRYEAMQDGNR